MRIKVSSIIAVISIVLYAAAIGSGGIQIITGINERRALARTEFYGLVDTASRAGEQGFMEEPFKTAVRNAVTGSKTLQAVIITVDGAVDFTFDREDRGLIIREGNTARFRTRFGFSRDPHSRPLRVDGARNTVIKAVSNDIDSSAIPPILIQSLLLVLAAVVLSIVTLLFSSSEEGKKKAAAPIPEEPEEPEEIREAADQEPDFSEEPLEDIPSVSPPTIREKLDEELGRCTDADQDLTLIFMELSLGAGSGIGDDAVVYRTFIGRARQFFTDRDLVLENGDRGISIFLPGASLEDSFDKARQFHSRMLTALPEIFTAGNDLRIGISARSGRILGADRLLLEASKALERAGQEPESPIVAFKSDPEKYRAFVQSHGKRI
jgi:hypothetical protein